MPDYPKSGRCPVCLKTEYQRLLHSVRKNDGSKGYSQRETDYYCCSGCTTIFKDPRSFVQALHFRAFEQKLIAEGATYPADCRVLGQGGIEMLVLTRHVGESVKIGDDVEVILLLVDGQSARIGIQAPKEVLILRTELLTEKEKDGH